MDGKKKQESGKEAETKTVATLTKEDKAKSKDPPKLETLSTKISSGFAFARDTIWKKFTFEGRQEQISRPPPPPPPLIFKKPEDPRLPKGSMQTKSDSKEEKEQSKKGSQEPKSKETDLAKHQKKKVLDVEKHKDSDSDSDKNPTDSDSDSDSGSEKSVNVKVQSLDKRHKEKSKKKDPDKHHRDKDSDSGKLQKEMNIESVAASEPKKKSSQSSLALEDSDSSDSMESTEDIIPTVKPKTKTDKVKPQGIMDTDQGISVKGSQIASKLPKKKEESKFEGHSNLGESDIASPSAWMKFTAYKGRGGASTPERTSNPTRLPDNID